MYDIGIVGCWYWGNYGSLLNGYATFSTLKSLGMQPLNIVSPYNGFEPHAKRLFDAVYSEKDISEVLPFERLREFNSICNMFMTGSDQIWHYDPNKDNQKYDYYFRLNFAYDHKKKISYATSLGKLEPEKNEVYLNYKRLYDRYDAISLREKQAVEYFKIKYGIQATELIEPVFVPKLDLWHDLADRSDIKIEGDFLFSYILDPTPQKREYILYVSKQLGLPSINALDGFSGIYDLNKRKLDLQNTLPNIWCADLINHFSKSKYVITDSFHGVCFALIFNKPFIAIINHERGKDRFISLLSRFGLEERLTEGHLNIEECNRILKKTIPSNSIRQVIENCRQKSIDWLNDAIKETPFKGEYSHKAYQCINDVLDKERCVGCGACKSICHNNSIDLKTDERGIYRSYVNSELCTRCGECIKVCPAMSLPTNLNTDNPEAFAYKSYDEKIIMESSSGGAFSSLAELIIQKGGVVFGAEWTTDFHVKHTCVTNIEELAKLRKSKYLQSYMGNIFTEVQEWLERGNLVLFVGTPCQIAGLKKFIKTPNPSLILVDLFCANCSSSKLFELYRLDKFGEDSLCKFEFRYKKEAIDVWNCNSSYAILKDGEIKIQDKDQDSYLKMFHSCSLGLSSQCRTCNYQGTKRLGDITFGDCWGIEKYDGTIAPQYGVSAVLANNEKGMYWINKLNKSGLLKREPLEEIKKSNNIAFISHRQWKQSIRSKLFWSKLDEIGFERAVFEVENLKSEEIAEFKIVAFDSLNVTLQWSTNINGYVTGYIIEQYDSNKWSRKIKIEDKNTFSCTIPHEQNKEKYMFRIQTYYLDGGASLYGSYKETSLSFE